MAQIRRFRRQGYATELNEANEHAGCVAAPVIDASGRCIAALSIVAPEQRMIKKNRDIPDHQRCCRGQKTFPEARLTIVRHSRPI